MSSVFQVAYHWKERTLLRARRGLRFSSIGMTFSINCRKKKKRKREAIISTPEHSLILLPPFSIPRLATSNMLNTNCLNLYQKTCFYFSHIGSTKLFKYILKKKVIIILLSNRIQSFEKKKNDRNQFKEKNHKCFNNLIILNCRSTYPQQFLPLPVQKR